MPHRHRSTSVCVLGGSGFVGRQLAGLLVREGYSVRIPTRNRQGARKLLVLPGVEMVQADVHDERSLSRLLSGSDITINLVGITNEKGHRGKGFRIAHTELSKKLFAACQENGIERLIQLSTLKANTEHSSSYYLRTKGQAEKILKDLAGEELHLTIFQPSAIFGPEDTFINRIAASLRVLPVLPLPRPKTQLAPVFVGDVAAAIVRSLENSHTYGKTYQLCGPEAYSLSEIVAYVRDLLGLKRAIVGLPNFLSPLYASVTSYLIPGKPFSLDNLRSMAVGGVCTKSGLDLLGVKATSMETVVPQYLSPKNHHQRQLSRLRRNAGR